MARQIIRLDEKRFNELVAGAVKETLRHRLNEGGNLWRDKIPDEIIKDIEENFGNHSITSMDSSWYVVAVDGQYGFYEIDVPANGHNRIKMYKVNNHGNSEDDQWLYDDSNWFEMCEGHSQQDDEPSFDRYVNSLNEDWDDYGDDGLDDYTSELLGSMERKDKAANQAMGKSAEKKVDSNFVRTLFNTDMGSLFDYDFDDESEEEETDDVQSGSTNDGNVLYNKAMEALATTNGSITFNEWFEEVSDEVGESEAKQVFSAAKTEFDSYDVDDASDFSDRENVQTSDSTLQNQTGEQQHQAGNTLEYDGIQVTDDGYQFTMVAKEDNPQITIKGSDFKDVTDMYDRLWNNYARMEDVARNMGFTIYHGAYLWLNDYDKFVRAAGGHEENLPILIDLDRVQSRGKKTNTAPHQQQSQGSQDGEVSWMDKYLHSNGKYMMTPYQLNQLTPEQQAEWNRMAKKFPNKYKTYSQSSK